MTSCAIVLVFAALVALVPVATGRAALLDSLVRRYPADSLVLPLRRFENTAMRPRESAQAAMMLGHLHYARGEYRRAAEAFSRAAARLDPASKPEARYWSGMGWLALGDHGQARAAFDELAHDASPRRDEARFGTALAWELARRPERAHEILEPLSRTVQGELAPAVLEHAIGVAERLKRPADAPRRRLLREFPRSIEAMRIGLAPARTSTWVVELGPFPTEPSAHAVATRARQAGHAAAHATIRETGTSRGFVVRLGAFASAEDARREADRARRDLGMAARVMAGP